MRKMRLGLAAVSLLALAAPAAALPYLFVVSDANATYNGTAIDPTYSFYLDGSPTPDASVPDTYFIASTSYNYSINGVGQAPLSDVATFFTDMNGFNTAFNLYTGPALFDGSTDAPTFKTGTFAFDDDVSVTVTAVPEPASWAMMIAGFGLVGAGLRSRRTRVVFA